MAASVRSGPYADRAEAGRALAGQLGRYAGRDDVVVLALPRGGVPVAAVVAESLPAALDVLVVRKLGLPGRPELAMGAIAAVGNTVEVVRNEDVLGVVPVSDEAFDTVYRRELAELWRRAATYRGECAPVAIGGRTVLLVDDGLATGSTMRAAVAAVRRQQPDGVVIALPIAAEHSLAALRSQVDDLVCVWCPQQFVAVGQGYLDFAATTDEQVSWLLARAAS